MALPLFPTDKPATRPQHSHTFIGGKVAPAKLAPLRRRFERMLTPLCSQIEVAGSVRRRAQLVKDLEYVIIERKPRTVRQALAAYCTEKMIDPAEYFIKRGDRMLVLREYLPTGQEIHVELYISQPEYFGYTLMVRTGSLHWNKEWMTYLKHIRGCEIKDNRVYTTDRRFVQFKTEQELFNFIGCDFVDPQVRNHSRDFKAAMYQAGLWDPGAGYKRNISA